MTFSRGLPLEMAASETLSSSPKHLKRLNAEEEAEFLRQAVESRRLNELEKEWALKSPTKKDLPLLSIRAEAAGYGDDLEAYEEAKYDGQKAREELVTRSMGLVQYCVNNILSGRKNKRMNSLSRDDLVQEGAIGLARAVDRWNPEIGGRFSTYAVYWIRAATLRCIAERDDMLRVPSHVSQAVREINKAARRLGLDLNAGDNIWKQATEAKQLAEEAGLSERNFEEAMKVRSRRYTGGYVAFEQWMQLGEDLQSDVPTKNSDPGMSSLESEHLRTTLSKFLRPKEMEALSWRYGLLDEDASANIETPQVRANRYFSEAEKDLFGTAQKKKAPVKKANVVKKGRFGEAMTFNEVGNKMQVSAEYTRKLCHAALDKLRRAADEGRLEPALLI
jgi:RNA polymerase nonessential primary-like sigma factor